MERLKSVSEEYARVGQITQSSAISLCETRKESIQAIREVESYVNTLANTPREFHKQWAEVHIYIDRFQGILDIEYDDMKNAKTSGGIAGAGALAGAGVAAFGPTAAMAIATTFGTASTGTAIVSLSGAAATKAALAWLGGGALVKGGAGIVGGKALLALAGPVGWAIGGTALVSGALFARKKNAALAEKAQRETIDVIKKTKVLEALTLEVLELKALTEALKRGLLEVADALKDRAPKDYRAFSETQRQDAGSLVNNAHTLSALINKTVGEESKHV